MAPKGRWGRKERDGSRVEAPSGPAAAPVLEVRRKRLELKEEDCSAVLLENYYSIAECERFMSVLRDEIDWKRQEVTLSQIPGDSKTVGEPRMTLFMSDEGVCYAYSGRDNAGVSWHPAILEIKSKAEAAVEECGLPRTIFNSVQMNRYNGPRHTLGLHKDNEPDLAKGVPIASVSFGAPREFVMQHGVNSDVQHKAELTDGSFFVMGGAMQSKYLHGIPVGASGLRFNLTFRVCIPRHGVDAGPPITIRQPRPGDWTCQDCREMVFASKSSCRGCGAAKPVAAPLVDSTPHTVYSSRGEPDAVSSSRGEHRQGKSADRLGVAARVERRIDPHDGRTYAFEAIKQHYAKDFSDKEIHDYWYEECKIVLDRPPGPASGVR